MTKAYTQFAQHLKSQIQDVKADGLYKSERTITSHQDSEITVNGKTVLNFCANNYLGLANHPAIIQAGQDGLGKYGYGLASVRFICGTQDLHKTLEQRLSAFLGTDDTILYSSCFDANGGLFETLLTADDAIVSDSLNHASIIDGVRLSKAKRYRYANNDMADLETQLKQAQSDNARHILIATDGVFSMDGYVANLTAVCDLADKYNAMVMVDDSHAVGVIGATGKGSHEHCGVMDRVDIITGTLGKALGGASGGYTSARAEIVEWLRQRSRPYLFSNTLAPAIASGTLAVLDLMESEGADRLAKLRDNAQYFRTQMESLGFELLQGDHPIIPVMIGDAELATRFADKLLDHGVYVIGFSYPVVPKGQARIRTQMSAGHTRQHLEQAVQAFAKVGRELGIIGG